MQWVIQWMRFLPRYLHGSTYSILGLVFSRYIFLLLMYLQLFSLHPQDCKQNVVVILSGSFLLRISYSASLTQWYSQWYSQCHIHVYYDTDILSAHNGAKHKVLHRTGCILMHWAYGGSQLWKLETIDYKCLASGGMQP